MSIPIKLAVIKAAAEPVTLTKMQTILIPIVRTISLRTVLVVVTNPPLDPNVISTSIHQYELDCMHFKDDL